MRQVVRSLPFVSRSLAVCAVLAGLGAAYLEASLGAGFVCFDTCPTRAPYFAHLDSLAVKELMPCVVLEALAFTAFLTYCLATRQTRRALITLLVLLVGGLLGFATLTALAQHAQATLPVGEGGLLVETPLVAWQSQWGLSLALVAGAWSGVLAYLQWGAEGSPHHPTFGAR